MAEKKTAMVLKVDLQCPCCYKKIQKILCKTPQVSDRYFDEKTNTVMISVICCSPEKIRDKLLCKGGKIIKSIEIKEPAKPPKEAPKPKDDKPKETPKPKDDKPKEAPKPKDTEQKPKEAEKKKESEKPKEEAKPKSNGTGNAPPPAAADKPKVDPKPGPPKNPAPPPGAIPVGLPPAHPVNPCCGPCYEGRGGGPCYHGYGFPPPPPQPCYDGYYGPEYVYGRPCYVTRCDYFSEENSTGCTIM